MGYCLRTYTNTQINKQNETKNIRDLSLYCNKIILSKQKENFPKQKSHEIPVVTSFIFTLER